LLKAALDNNQSEVLQLIAAGANINATDDKGRTALMHAIKADYTPMVRFLLENGADVEIKDKDGRKALDYAYSIEREYFQQMFMNELKRRKQKANSNAYKGTLQLANISDGKINPALSTVASFLNVDPAIPNAVGRVADKMGTKAGRKTKKRTTRKR